MRQTSALPGAGNQARSVFRITSFCGSGLSQMNLKLRQIRIGLLVFSLILVSGGIGYWLGTNRIKLELGKRPQLNINRLLPEDKKEVNLALFWQIWDLVSASYLDSSAIDGEKMINGAIQGMVASLGDPYTVFLPPEDNQQAKEDLNGEFNGVGIQLDFDDDQRLVVIAPLARMPAEQVGVKAGDLILKVDGEETLGWSLPQAVREIRGKKGTKVTLTLLHRSETEPYEVEITRDTIIVPSVELELIDSVAHLKLTRFGERTSEEWEPIVAEILDFCRTDCDGVILDLRNNPGGYLDLSVFVAAEFLPSGVVVQQEGANGAKELFSVNRRGQLTEIPLVVLINQGSASASEIVAGALQEYGRAQLVGETTFGKGTIQEAQDFPGGAGLHLTTARWLLPKGRSINKDGISPDVEVKDDLETEADEQLDKAVDLLTGN